MRIAQDLQDKIDSLNYEKKQYSQDEIENYESIVAWTIYFAAFFDGKMEYEYSTGKIRAVINLLKRYASYDLTKKYLKNPLRYTKKIPALSYKIMLGGFAFLMKWNMYVLLSLGIKLLVYLLQYFLQNNHFHHWLHCHSHQMDFFLLLNLSLFILKIS